MDFFKFSGPLSILKALIIFFSMFQIKVKLAEKPKGNRRENEFHNVRRIGGSSTNDEDDEGDFYKRKESKLL